ncbi:MAG: diacylglycerol/lipid kinase family protein [Pararhizobium sp.]
MRIQAVFNRDGGTFRTMDMEAYCRRATEVFEAHGHDFSCAIVEGREVESALAEAAGRGDLDAIIAGGGDGTISTAAGICWKEGMPLGVVPAGTMNLFARSLKLPLDVEEVLEVLAAGTVRNADIASANGRAYIHQYSVGLHARMVRLRNSYRFSSRLGKMRASVRAAFNVMFDPPVFTAICEVNGVEEKARTSAISISNNHFGADPLLFAESLSGGELGIYIAGAMTPGSVAHLVFDILRGKLKESEVVSERGATHVVLRFPRLSRRANAVMDGELLPLEPEVSIRLHAGELKVLAPATPAGEAATGTPSRRSS